MKDDWNSPLHVARVKIHVAIFASYVEIYRNAVIMTGKMDEVLDHPEHKALIDGGESLGYSMPDVNAVRARNHFLKAFIAGLDPLYDITVKDNIIDCPARTAQRLHFVAHYSSVLIDDIVRNIQGSDYMLWIRTVRDAGHEYQGPTSLQEAFNVWCHLMYTSAKEKALLPEPGRRLPAAWVYHVT